MHLEEADVAAMHVGAPERLVRRSRRCRESQRVVAVLDPEPVRHHGRTEHADGAVRGRARLARAGHHHCCRAVADRRGVVEAQRSTHHGRRVHIRGRDHPVVEEGVRVVVRVRVGVQGEAVEVGDAQPVAVQVQLHQPGILAEQRGSRAYLALGVQRLRERGHHVRAVAAHLLDAECDRDLRLAAGNREVGHPQSGCAGGCGRPHLQGLRPDQPGLVRDQAGDVLLALQLIGQHVADEQRVGAVRARVGQRPAHGRCAEFAQRELARPEHRQLADAHDADAGVHRSPAPGPGSNARRGVVTSVGRGTTMCGVPARTGRGSVPGRPASARGERAVDRFA